MHQFCVGAAKGVLSPFVLQEIVMETLQRLSPAHAHNHLRAPAFHQLVQRCQQAYMQVTTWAVRSRVKHLGRQGEALAVCTPPAPEPSAKRPGS